MSEFPAIEQMSTEEKLRAMEELWLALSAKPRNVPSPDWHGEVLRAREASTAEDFTDWEDVKRRLRDRTS